MYARVLKRPLDLFLACLVVVITAPLTAVVAFAVRLEDGGPVLFRQVRIGRDGAPFTLRKFRSMPAETADVPSALATDLHITKVGRMLRRTNIDELPQVFNVIGGDMSLIGPRPALPYQEELTRWRRKQGALRVRPGLTGLAQVNAYDGMPDVEKADWDRRYVDELSFRNDLRILLRTFAYLMRRPPQY